MILLFFEHHQPDVVYSMLGGGGGGGQAINQVACLPAYTQEKELGQPQIHISTRTLFSLQELSRYRPCFVFLSYESSLFNPPKNV